MSVTPSRVPVTVLTGFLGSGKTTLLNRILSEKHGQRIAVSVNDVGEGGVDHQLVIGGEGELCGSVSGGGGWPGRQERGYFLLDS
jgi:G3E family GTPase